MPKAHLHLVEEDGKDLPPDLDQAIHRARSLLLTHQRPEGYWWYTLEANETINSEYIFLMHYMGMVDKNLQEGLCRRIEKSQRMDGSWALYHDGAGDLSTTLECYFALKLGGRDIQSSAMVRARDFILRSGGMTQCRIFTRIHLAMFGLIPWNKCPAMPIWFMLFPVSAPISIYEFSSWARATIVPLLILRDREKIAPLPENFLDELYAEKDVSERKWTYGKRPLFSWENLFIQLDKILHAADKIGLKPFRKLSLKKGEAWIREHIAKTEDIYPAMAYGAMALHVLGHSNTDPTVEKCLKGLSKFQIPFEESLSPLPPLEPTLASGLYQQCCVSPVWDTPWTGVALLEAGEPADSPALLKSGRWLIQKQVVDTYGDWFQKNKKAFPGGWSFEFENDYFPDVDDTIEVIHFLKNLALPEEEKKEPIRKGLNWLLSMQCKNGGWAAFDVDNTLEIANKIPFSDHGACLDPPTPDITARAIELLSRYEYREVHPVIAKAIRFLEKTQESNGSWPGRWGVNYLYGTWCVLTGLSAIGYDLKSEKIQKAVSWLKSVQREDGGYGESCRSYDVNHFVTLPESVPSQTAWALMGLVAAGEAQSEAAEKAVAYLMKNQKDDGGWDELHHTGTGFPGHFYIRYHGYRHFFPLLALGLYKKGLLDAGSHHPTPM